MNNKINYSELGKCITPAFKREIDLFKTSNNITFVNSDIALECTLLLETLRFLKKRKVNLLMISGPNKHKLKFMDDDKYLYKKITLESTLKDTKFIRSFCHDNPTLLKYIYDEKVGILTGNRITTNGIHLMSAYFKSDLLNVNALGERKSISSIEGKIKSNIYIYGSCLSFGLFADDNSTFPSFLQKKINHSELAGMKVHNYGLKGQNCVLNDLLFVLNTPIQEGDWVILVEKYSQELENLLRQQSIDLHDFSNYLNNVNLEGPNFLNSAFHCNQIIYQHLADYTFSLILNNKEINLDTSNKSKYSYFAKTLKDVLINSDLLLDRIFIQDLISELHDKRFEHDDDAIIGSVVFAANPFTWGHAKLIDLMAKECDYCYVFVIEDEHFTISFDKRYEMVEQYAKQYKNCKTIATGKYFGADFLFPEYHDRQKYKKQKINNPIIDTIIFAKHIAHLLNINRRYLGSEESDPVTKQFNEYLSSTLPKYGIEVKIIKRFTSNNSNEEIKGELVRKMINEGANEEKLSDYLPYSSIQVLLQPMERNRMPRGQVHAIQQGVSQRK